MSKINITWKQVFQRLQEIDYSCNFVYGIPNGGMIASAFLQNAVVEEKPHRANIILDDLVDSGATAERFKTLYPDKRFYALFDKTKDIQLQNKWLVFPWEAQHPKYEQMSIHDNIVRILQYLGEDVSRPGLIDTPKRVVKMYDEIFQGYNPDKKPKISVFGNGNDGVQYDQMIYDTGDFYSHCEHHMVPFFGKYWFAYIPSKNGSIIGLSKVARIVDYHAARLQIQERLVEDIVEDLWHALSENYTAPLGMGLIMQGEHLCKTMRGVKKKGKMITTKLKGLFLTNPEIKQEFLNRCKI